MHKEAGIPDLLVYLAVSIGWLYFHWNSTMTTTAMMTTMIMMLY